MGVGCEELCIGAQGCGQILSMVSQDGHLRVGAEGCKGIVFVLGAGECHACIWEETSMSVCLLRDVVFSF